MIGRVYSCMVHACCPPGWGITKGGGSCPQILWETMFQKRWNLARILGGVTKSNFFWQGCYPMLLKYACPQSQGPRLSELLIFCWIVQMLMRCLALINIHEGRSKKGATKCCFKHFICKNWPFFKHLNFLGSLVLKSGGQKKGPAK